MSSGRFHFASGNLAKLFAIPKYLLSWLCALVIPRKPGQWAFGSGIGVGEGALALARELRRQRPDAVIYWLVSNDAQAQAALAESFTPVRRSSRHGFWATLRAETIVVTHGLGDVNRFGVFGGHVVQLWHGAPLKRIHLDSKVTTTVGGPAILYALLGRMYARGAQQVSLYVAGSVTAAERLRSAFRVDPGKVRVLGDPRDDVLARQALDGAQARAARARVTELLQATSPTDPGIPDHAALVLYAPTWRDGDPDPAIPTRDEIDRLADVLARANAHLIIRSHPLGAGEYEHAVGERVHLLGSELAHDITPLLGAFDAVITDYSSIAIDYSLLGRPIVWFATDLERYTATRGLYEPLEVTAGGAIERSWDGVARQLPLVLAPHTRERRESTRQARQLALRFHNFPTGGAAARVLDAISQLSVPARDLIAPGAILFESYYGRQVSCNPLAIDREIAARYPHSPRYWSVTSERQAVPEGAIPVLVGGRDWFAARRYAKLLVVNDWLRYGFRRAPGQVVLQTWHGTMLKHLALGRPKVSLRTRLAIRRESNRWSLLLAQNPHATQQFRASYAYSGEILETGYPRDDRLARAVLGDGRNAIAVSSARAALGIPADTSVLVYAPTWRDRGVTVVDELDVAALAADLGEKWTVVARGHTRTLAFGGYAGVVDASTHPDVNDVILAADVVVTDYSSLMFDTAVARVPMLFFVPDLESYRDRERGFTFDFERDAPGPLLTRREQVVAHARALHADGALAEWIRAYGPAATAWRDRFAPHDDGHAAARVVDRLEALGVFSE